jgi:hypothetical protein
MESKGRAHVCWVYATDDAPIARELMGRAAVLETQGLVKNWMVTGGTLDLLTSTQEATMRGMLDARLATLRADIAVFLCSNALLESPGTQRVLTLVAQDPATRVVPVLLGATVLPPDLAAYDTASRWNSDPGARQPRGSVARSDPGAAGDDHLPAAGGAPIGLTIPAWHG